MKSSDEFRNPIKENVIDIDRIDERRIQDKERVLELVKRDAGAERPLLDQRKARELHDRWNNIQSSFIDEPRKAVEDANQVIDEVIGLLADAFDNERKAIGRKEGRAIDGPPSTEDMRLALQRYRSLFTRLVSM